MSIVLEHEPDCVYIESAETGDRPRLDNPPFRILCGRIPARSLGAQTVSDLTDSSIQPLQRA
jgi:hypothetical protein